MTLDVSSGLRPPEDDPAPAAGVHPPPVDLAAAPGRMGQRWPRWLAAVAAVAVIPRLVGNQGIGQANLVLIATIGAVALNMVQGVAGQLSVGNAAFMAVGAFTVASFTHYLGLPFLVVIPLACVVAAILGLLVGIPAIRVRGIYLLIASLAFQYVTSFAFERYQSKAAGPAGFTIPIAQIGPWQVLSQTDWYVVWAAVALGALWLMSNVKRTRVGRSWMAIRANEDMAAASGVNVARTIVIVFGISAALIGLQGGLFSYYVGVVQYDTFTTDLAIQYVAMVLIGGEGSVLGPVLGALTIETVPWAINRYLPTTGFIAAHTADIQGAIYGVLIIAVLIFEPSGLTGIGSRLRRLAARHGRPAKHQVLAS